MIVCFQGPYVECYGTVDVNSPLASLIIILARFLCFKELPSLALRGVATNVRKPSVFVDS